MTAQIMVEDVTGEMVALKTDFGAQAQKAAEAHLADVWAHFHSEDGYEDPDVPSPAIGAFDGCQTCEVREVLFAAIPFIEAGLRREDEANGAAARELTINLIACPNEEALVDA